MAVGVVVVARQGVLAVDAGRGQRARADVGREAGDGFGCGGFRDGRERGPFRELVSAVVVIAARAVLVVGVIVERLVGGPDPQCAGSAVVSSRGAGCGLGAAGAAPGRRDEHPVHGGDGARLHALAPAGAAAGHERGVDVVWGFVQPLVLPFATGGSTLALAEDMNGVGYSLKDPADAHTLHHAATLAHLFHRALATVLVHDVGDSNP